MNDFLLGPKLQHKLHIIVGTQDQFDLEPPVLLLKDDLQRLGSDAEIDLAPGSNHFSIMDWNGGAIRYILNEARSLLPPGV